jgi:hypothetical protein
MYWSLGRENHRVYSWQSPAAHKIGTQIPQAFPNFTPSRAGSNRWQPLPLTPPSPPMDLDDGRYEEIDATLREVVKLFSERTDIKTVLEAGHATAELKSLCEARHKEIQQTIRGARATPALRGISCAPCPTRCWP